MVRNLSTASASLRVITDIHLCWFNDVDDCAATLRWRNGLSGDDMKRCIETLMVLLRWSVWCLLPGAECLMMLRRDNNAATEHVQKFRERGDDVAIKDSCSWRQAAARLGTRVAPPPIERLAWHQLNNCLSVSTKRALGWLAVVSALVSMSAAKSNSCLPQVATPATYYHKLCLQPPLNQK